MNYITVEVDIDHGRIVPRQPEKLPDVARGILTVLPDIAPRKREPIQLPIIKGDGKNMINPTPEELDASFFGD